MRAIVSGLIVLGLFAGAAQGVIIKDTTALGDDPAVKDAGLKSTDPDANLGITPDIRIYPTGGPFYNPVDYGPIHALMQFDVSYSGMMGQTLNPGDATLNFYVSPRKSTKNGANYFDMQVSRLLPGKAWTEGTADGAAALPGEVTWNSQSHLSAAWDTAGATAGTDIDLATSSTFTITRGATGEKKWVSVDVTDIAQAWLNGEENNGMLIWGGWSDAQLNAFNFWAISSSECADVSIRPYLEIIPEPASLSLLALGSVALLRRRK